MKYYIIAGEASGDLHGSNLMKGLFHEDPDADIRFWGGDLMSEVGGTIVKHYKDGAVMGLWEVMKKSRSLLNNARNCQKDILEWHPDVVILIDYPGFNLKMARFAKENGFKVFYYIAPKVWASREGRIETIRKYVDKLFIVFPFEIPYFEKKGLSYVYKGNPLLDAIDNHQFIPVSEDPYIVLLAGSRKNEIARMMPVCMEVADRIGCNVIVAGAPARSSQDYEPYIAGRKNVSLVFGKTYDLLKYADAAIINSGTASLEAALIGTPQVVCWSTSRLTAFVARKILHVMDNIKFISLGNLCVDRLIFKELVQEEFNADSVAEEVIRLMNDHQYREEMLRGYDSIRMSLGGKGASAQVARAMIDSLQSVD